MLKQGIIFFASFVHFNRNTLMLLCLFKILKISYKKGIASKLFLIAEKKSTRNSVLDFPIIV